MNEPTIEQVREQYFLKLAEENVALHTELEAHTSSCVDLAAQLAAACNECDRLKNELEATKAELKQEKENGVQAEVTIGLLRVMVEDLKKSLSVTQTQYEATRKEKPK